MPKTIPRRRVHPGAGAAGILLATQLASAGLRVIALEGGGRLLEKQSQDIYQSEVAGWPHAGIHKGRYRTLGGSTTEWGGQILELDEEDFLPREWVPGSGWPFAKEVLIRHYARALEFAGLRRSEADDSAIWRDLGKQPPILSPEFYMAFSRFCPERNFAKLHAGTLAESRRLALYCHANATGFVLNEARTAIKAVSIRSFTRRTATVSADQFVVCMGGIESTRFLLQPAEDGTLPWQINGILGRYFQDHVVCDGIRLGNLQTQPAHEWFGYISSRSFIYHCKIRLSSAQQAAHCTLNVAGNLGPVNRHNVLQARALQTLRRVRNGNAAISAADAAVTVLCLPSLATDHLSKRLRGGPPPWKGVMLSVHTEQSPLSASTVMLSPLRDELGLLRTRLDWRISAEEVRTIRTYVKLCESTFKRHGFAQVDVPAGFYEDDAVLLKMCGDNFHHMGSTRMAAVAQEGVVDPDLRLYGIANGYLCSSSVFPCSGFSNPTHTLLALAIRLSDHLIQLHGNSKAEMNEESGRTTPYGSTSNARPVLLPGRAGRMTSQLGFGCAYLFAGGTGATGARRMLDAAWDAGIRHFDVAPMYGGGRSEELLGQFLTEHPEATVTTKFGLLPQSGVRRVAAAFQRRIPGLGRLRLVDPNPQKVTRFVAAEASASLARSARLLRRDFIDLVLLHEPEEADLVHDDLLEFLVAAKEKGNIGDFGIGGEFRLIPALRANRKSYCRVLQFEWSLLGPALDLPGAYRIHYRVFAPAAARLRKRFEKDPDLLRNWSAVTGHDLEEPAVLSRLLLKAAWTRTPTRPYCSPLAVRLTFSKTRGWPRTIG